MTLMNWLNFRMDMMHQGGGPVLAKSTLITRDDGIRSSHIPNFFLKIGEPCFGPVFRHRFPFILFRVRAEGAGGCGALSLPLPPVSLLFCCCQGQSACTMDISLPRAPWLKLGAIVLPITVGCPLCSDTERVDPNLHPSPLAKGFTWGQSSDIHPRGSVH